MGEQRIWHDERGRRITSVRYMGTDLYVHTYADDPDDATDRHGVDEHTEGDGDPAADAGPADATYADTGAGPVGL